MTEENIYLTSENNLSKLTAIFEDDGISAWLYLHKSNSVIFDAWVYNRISTPSKDYLENNRNSPPPAVQGFASETSLYNSPKDHKWSFLWSKDGMSVALLKDNIPISCIVSNLEQSYSKELIKNGPWGNTWSKEIYNANFG